MITYDMVKWALINNVAEIAANPNDPRESTVCKIGDEHFVPGYQAMVLAPAQYVRLLGLENMTDIVFAALDKKKTFDSYKKMEDFIHQKIRETKGGTLDSLYPLKKEKVYVVKEIIHQNDFTEPEYYEQAEDTEVILGIYKTEKAARLAQVDLLNANAAEVASDGGEPRDFVFESYDLL